MRGTVLVCGRPGESPQVPEGVAVHALPARPGRSDIDSLLTDALVVVGSDADLAAVALRLLRRERLDATTVGYVPVDRDSAVARLWGLPANPRDALALALSGEARPVPLVRDDAGGVLVGHGVIRQPRGVAYCDDTLALRGEAASITVRPGPAGLVATITRGRLLRRRTVFEGRAFQLGTAPVRPVSDGVPYPRPLERWTWYRHTHDLRLVLPAR
ncbi:hypothetical protein [Prauserella muralis]|uniref:DAGKc domain-containing protein n=1 Tax=Prauserella muralis TaxID=588067 RepID=A0A2V4B8A5_9PSEU|nr:hypothetical protein [Prauserella muralis]PXY31480.1 hypothetical protein BAY60_03645 [Prauserella muralis]